MIAEGLLGRLQRPRPLGRRGRLRRPRLRTIIAAVVLAALLGGGWLWLRDSSLVAVSRVTITGARGPDADQIRSALRAAAHDMTTLDVRVRQLKTAVAPYPVVQDIRVTTHFPHALHIEVIERTPVAAVLAAGRKVAVAGDGTLLHDVASSSSLPSIPLRVPPGGRRLSDPGALRAVSLLAAAPSQLLGRITQVTTVTGHGLVAQLRDGPSLYFGDASRAEAKWSAAVAVLADPGSAGALYIDLSDPERPAAGVGSAGLAGTADGSGSAVSADAAGGSASSASGG